MFAKLFSSITESSLWSEPKEVRLLFVSMLARADQNGFVEASIPGLARVANLTLEETQFALEVLQNPDPHSKNPADEGRRIAKVPGGFALINYDEYRSRRDDNDRKEYMRNYMVEYRKSRKQPVNNVNESKPPLAAVSQEKPRLAHTEAEAEAEAEENTNTTSAKRGQVYDSDFEAFWSSFPKARRTKKQEAYRRWKSALKRTDAEVLIKKAAEYAASPKGQSEFAVMPSVWLNSGMWEDSPESWGDQNTKAKQKPNPKTQVLNPRVDCAETGGEYVPGYPYKWMD